MFKEIAYITCILSTVTLGTEFLFRYKPSNNNTGNNDYILQSNMVLISSAIGLFMSLFILRHIERIPKIQVQGSTALILCFFLAAVALRSRFHFLLSQEYSKLNLYNITSVFLVVTMAAWSTFWFFKNQKPPLQPTMPLSANHRNIGENNIPSIHRYDAEIDYTLPSYSELPSPPAYTKLTIPPSAVTTNRELSTLELTTSTQSNCEVNNEIDQNTNRPNESAEASSRSNNLTADSVPSSIVNHTALADSNNGSVVETSGCTSTALPESSSASARNN